MLTNEEVVTIVSSCPTRSYAARAVVDSAVRAWRSIYPTSKVDDCAVVCLFLASATATKKDDRPDLNELSRSGTVRKGNGATGEGKDEAFG